MAWVFVAMSDALVDGFGPLGHAREHASAQTLSRDVAEESLTRFRHDAEVGLQCMLNRQDSAGGRR